MNTFQNNNETYFHFRFFTQEKKLCGPASVYERNGTLLFSSILIARNIWIVVYTLKLVATTNINVLKKDQ